MSKAILDCLVFPLRCHMIGPENFRYFLNPLTPKIVLLLLPSSCYTFPWKISNKNLVLNQDNDSYLISLNILITCFPVLCLDNLGRSFMLITSESSRVNQSNSKLKPITTCSPTSFHASGILLVFTLSYRWLFNMFSFLNSLSWLIWFWFYDTQNWRLLHCYYMINY